MLRPGGGDAGRVGRRSSASTAAARGAEDASTSTSPEVWEALLEDMPMTALIRNLATMTRVGVLDAWLGRHREGRRAARRRGADPQGTRAPDRLARGSSHVRVGPRCPRPATSGTRCARSSTLSTRRSTRRSATSSRQARACCSRSTCRARWSGGWVAGVPGLTPRDASAALALVTAATEPRLRGRRLLRRSRAAGRRGTQGRGAGHTTA